MTQPTTKRPITTQDLYDLKLITAAQMSPDGRFVIYSQQRVDQTSEKKYTNLWLCLLYTSDAADD